MEKELKKFITSLDPEKQEAAKKLFRDVALEASEVVAAWHVNNVVMNADVLLKVVLGKELAKRN